MMKPFLVGCSLALLSTFGGVAAAEPLRAGDHESAPSEGATGEARQPLSPLGPLLCGAASLIATTVQDRACRSWRGGDSEVCNAGTFGSGSLWLFACSLAF